MLRLNKDVLFLVIEELQNDRKSLHSCLLVDRTWCEITIPLLWKNPWKFCPIDSAESTLLFNVILSHLPCICAGAQKKISNVEFIYSKEFRDKFY